MMIKISSLSVKEWESILSLVLGRLGYVFVSRVENENKLFFNRES